MYTQIIATGDDASRFLQGQLTQDFSLVTRDRSPLAAWCTPKGRVIAVLRLLTLDNGYGMVLPVSLAQPVIDGLLRYRLRAQFELQLASQEWQAIALTDARDLDALQSLGLLPERAANASCTRRGVTAVSMDSQRSVIEVYAEPAALDAAALEFRAPLSAELWAAQRIQAGIADIGVANTEQYTPHMLNLDAVDAVSFTKGCYPGQEIVARTEHLGAVKRRVARYRHNGPSLPIGEAVQLADDNTGAIVADAAGWTLAIVPTDLQDKILTCDGRDLTPVAQTSGRM